MDRDALVERMAEAAWNSMPHATRYRKLTGRGKEIARHIALAALAVAEPVIQAAERERCAKVVDEAQAEVQANIDDNISEVRVVQMTPADNRPLIRVRDWLRHTAAAIRALTR